MARQDQERNDGGCDEQIGVIATYFIPTMTTRCTSHEFGHLSHMYYSHSYVYYFSFLDNHDDLCTFHL